MTGVQEKLLSLIEKEYEIMDEVPFSINQGLGENSCLHCLSESSYVCCEAEVRVARIFRTIRAELGTLGTPIGLYDLQIAAMATPTPKANAVVNNLTLVTHNTREFNRVSGLVIE